MAGKIINETTCPIDYAFRRIGGKYKGRALWALHNREILRYGELRKLLSDITPKMLTQTLRELEADMLVSRKVYQEVPPKVEYRLTKTGKSLTPFIDHLKDWGVQQMKKERQKMTR